MCLMVCVSLGRARAATVSVQAADRAEERDFQHAAMVRDAGAVPHEVRLVRRWHGHRVYTLNDGTHFW